MVEIPFIFTASNKWQMSTPPPRCPLFNPDLCLSVCLVVAGPVAIAAAAAAGPFGRCVSFHRFVVHKLHEKENNERKTTQQGGALLGC